MSVALYDQKAEARDVVCACVYAVTASSCSSFWLSRKIIQRCVSTVGISAAGGLRYCLPSRSSASQSFQFLFLQVWAHGAAAPLQYNLTSMCVLTCSQCWPGLPGSPEPLTPAFLFRVISTQSWLLQTYWPLAPRPFRLLISLIHASSQTLGLAAGAVAWACGPEIPGMGLALLSL